jgi:hypothetical protein
LLGQLRRFARGARVYPEPRTPLEIKVALFRVAKGAHQNEKVGFRVAPQDIVAIFTRLFALEATQEIPTLRKSRDQRDGRDTAILLRGQEHACVTGMHGKGEHATPEWSDAAGVNRSKIEEELLRSREGVRVRRLQPAEAADCFDAARFEGENDFRKIEPFHLG